MVKEFIEAQINGHDVFMFSKTYCPYCKMAKDALKSIGVEYTVVELEGRDDCEEVMDQLKAMTGGRTVPRVFVHGKFVGGGTEVKNMASSGELKKLVDKK